jgi:hypothetical protein
MNQPSAWAIGPPPEVSFWIIFLDPFVNATPRRVAPRATRPGGSIIRQRRRLRLHRQETRLVTAEGGSVPTRILPLPQGTLPIVGTYSVINLLTGKLPPERVLTLDNVHLAELLRARLADDRIECVLTSFRLRRLLYFFGSLFKMALLVPAADRERAERLVEETRFEIV